jgi:hypothetical protein
VRWHAQANPVRLEWNESEINTEIAVKLDSLERTVERKLRMIRDRWEKAP